jgi:hypothetical protein
MYNSSPFYEERAPLWSALPGCRETLTVYFSGNQNYAR